MTKDRTGHPTSSVSVTLLPVFVMFLPMKLSTLQKGVLGMGAGLFRQPGLKREKKAMPAFSEVGIWLGDVRSRTQKPGLSGNL